MSKLVAFAAIQGGYNVVSQVEGELKKALATYDADTKVEFPNTVRFWGAWTPMFDETQKPHDEFELEQIQQDSERDHPRVDPGGSSGAAIERGLGFGRCHRGFVPVRGDLGQSEDNIGQEGAARRAD